MTTRLLLALTIACSANAAPRPNILLFLADDCSYHDFGCYGNPDVRTPHVDGLAEAGMRFEHCFNSAPTCAPTRMSLMTGLHPVRNGAHPNHGKVYDHVRSLPRYLKALGYKVALIGKTHHSPQANFPFEFLGGRHHDNGTGMDLDLQKIDAFIADNRDRPWCLLVKSNQPHTPWNRGDASVYDPTALKLPPYLVDTPETRQGLAAYYAEISYMDAQLGACLKALDTHHLADNTVVTFLSEQGSNFPHCKWTCYDTGLRSAQVIRWPGKIKPGTVSQAMVQYVDWLPTMLAIAGGDPSTIDFDGSSYLPLLTGETDSHHNRAFGMATTRGIHHGPPAYGIRTIRTPKHRLIWNLNHHQSFRNSVTAKSPIFASWQRKADQGDAFATNRVRHYQIRPEFELYALADDPYELNNLSASPEYASILFKLKAELKDWMKQQHDQAAATEWNAAEHIDLNRNPKARKLKQTAKPTQILPAP